MDDQSQEEIRANRGTLTEPGTDSPCRGRTPAENLDLFRRMRAGEFPDGAKVLRAKIDMKSPNVVLRDPVLYRIKHVEHHRTGDAWCINPMLRLHPSIRRLKASTIPSARWNSRTPAAGRRVLYNLPCRAFPSDRIRAPEPSYSVLSSASSQLVTERSFPAGTTLACDLKRLSVEGG